MRFPPEDLVAFRREATGPAEVIVADHSMLCCVCLSTSCASIGTLSSGVFLESNSASPGQLIVVGAGASDLAGSGILVNITGTCGPGASSVSALAWTEFLFDNASIAVVLVPGSITVSGFGDVSDDGNVNVTDAVDVLKFIVGNILSLPCLTCADVNDDAQVNDAGQSEARQSR